MISAIIKCIKRRGSTRFCLYRTYFVSSTANIRLHDQPIHVRNLLSVTVDYLGLKVQRNASNAVLAIVVVTIKLLQRFHNHCCANRKYHCRYFKNDPNYYQQGILYSTLNAERRICGFSLWPEKTNFGDFRKFQEFPEVSLRISLRFLKFIGIS